MSILGGDATFMHPTLEVYNPYPAHAREHGISARGKLAIYGGLLKPEFDTYIWSGISLIGSGADGYLMIV